jgi:hypothetical protein
VPVGMPDEGQLPLGPRRELTMAIHVLYVGAGAPGLRRISNAIRNRDDLPDTVSHEAIRSILNGASAQWAKIQCLASQLLAWSVTRLDPAPELEKIHRLWLAAGEVGRLELSQPDGRHGERQLPGEPTFRGLPTGEDGSSQDIAGDPPDLSRQVERYGLIRRPLMTWNPRTGAIEVYDRQMAIQIIQGEIGRSNE